MKKKFSLIALSLLGLTLTACGSTGSVGLNVDGVDLEIDTEFTEYSVPVTKVNFEEGESDIVIDRGEKYSYSYSVEPAKALKKSLSWSSSNEEVATVEEGVVTGVGAGKAIIYVSNNEKSFTTISLNVEVIVPVQDIAFNQSTFAADLNNEYQLEVNYTPFDTTEKDVSWSIDSESVATISESGLLTTKGVTGTAKVSVTSSYINKVITLTVDVADRTIYPDSVIVDEYENKVEVGKNFTMKAHSVVSSDPNVQPTHPEVKYYSSNPNILTVEEDTGVVHAVDTGVTTIYATAMGKNGPVSSELKTINVFEVKVQTISLEDITLSNRNGRSEVKVPMTYTTDTEGYEVASIPNFKYLIGDSKVATVNDNGVLYAVAASGETTLTVEELRSNVSKTVNVHVGYEVDTVTLKGESEIDTGKTTQLSVTTEPSGIPASLISYSSSNEEVATVSESGLIQGISEGTATITVTVTGMNKVVSEAYTVKVNIPEIPFAYGTAYVVGDHNYYSGVSTVSSTGSWDHANQARVISESTATPGEKYTIIKFNEGDHWQVRVGDTYLPVYGHGDQYDIGTYNLDAGSFAGSHPDMTPYTGEDGLTNVLVNRTGYYSIYYAQYTNEHPEGWFNIYVGRHELTVSDSTPQIQVGHKLEPDLEAHSWNGTLTYEITEGSDLITVVRDDYKFAITAGDTAGEAKILFKDDYSSVEVVVTISSEAPLPKTFEANIPYVVGNADYHTGTATGSGEYWGTDASKAMKFTKSSADLPPGAINQYEATITFNKDNEFKVVIGGEELYWEVNYEKETGDTQNAFSKNQMYQQESGKKNIVVEAEGTYKIYVKCYNDDRGWQTFIEPRQSDPFPSDVPATDGYYIVGTESNWKFANATKLGAGSSGNLAQLIGYEAKANEEFRICGYHNEKKTWYDLADHGDEHYFVGSTAKTIDIYLNNIGIVYVNEHGSTPTTEKTFYFTLPDVEDNKSWNSLKAYVWNDSSKANMGDWPGVEMSYVDDNEYGQPVYSITIDTSLYDMIVFNSGDYQTVDIPLASFGTHNACYVSSGAYTKQAQVQFWTK